MSLRLLQKQVGSTPASGYGSRPRGGSWLGGRGGPGRGAYAGKGGGEGGGGGAYVGKGGRGRGAGAFLEGFAQEDDIECAFESKYGDSVAVDVPGLEEAFRSANLAPYVEAAREWCGKEGAETIEDVLDLFDTLADSIGLKLLERRRLLVRLQKPDQGATPSVGSTAGAHGAAAQPSPPPGLEELMTSASLQEKLPQASAWCVGNRVASLAELGAQVDAFVAALTLKPLEQKRLRKFLPQPAEIDVSTSKAQAYICSATANEAIVSQSTLEELFRKADLDVSLASAALLWTEGQGQVGGVMTLMELAGSIENLATNLKLKPLEQRRLKKVLGDVAPLSSAEPVPTPPVPPPAPPQQQQQWSETPREAVEPSPVRAAILAAKAAQAEEASRLAAATAAHAAAEAEVWRVREALEQARGEAEAQAEQAERLRSFHAESLKRQEEEASRFSSELRTLLDTARAEHGEAEAAVAKSRSDAEAAAVEAAERAEAAASNLFSTKAEVIAATQELQTVTMEAATLRRVLADEEMRVEAATSKVDRWETAYASETQASEAAARSAKELELQIREQLEESCSQHQDAMRRASSLEEEASTLAAKLEDLTQTSAEDARLNEAESSKLSDELSQLNSEVAHWRDAYEVAISQGNAESVAASRRHMELDLQLAELSAAMDVEAQRALEMEEALRTHLVALQEVKSNAALDVAKGEELMTPIRQSLLAVQDEVACVKSAAEAQSLRAREDWEQAQAEKQELSEELADARLAAKQEHSEAAERVQAAASAASDAAGRHAEEVARLEAACGRASSSVVELSHEVSALRLECVEAQDIASAARSLARQEAGELGVSMERIHSELSSSHERLKAAESAAAVAQAGLEARLQGAEQSLALSEEASAAAAQDAASSAAALAADAERWRVEHAREVQKAAESAAGFAAELERRQAEAASVREDFDGVAADLAHEREERRQEALRVQQETQRLDARLDEFRVEVERWQSEHADERARGRALADESQASASELQDSKESLRVERHKRAEDGAEASEVQARLEGLVAKLEVEMATEAEARTRSLSVAADDVRELHAQMERAREEHNLEAQRADLEAKQVLEAFQKRVDDFEESLACASRREEQLQTVVGRLQEDATRSQAAATATLATEEHRSLEERQELLAKLGAERDQCERQLTEEVRRASEEAACRGQEVDKWQERHVHESKMLENETYEVERLRKEGVEEISKHERFAAEAATQATELEAVATRWRGEHAAEFEENRLARSTAEKWRHAHEEEVQRCRANAVEARAALDAERLQALLLREELAELLGLAPPAAVLPDCLADENLTEAVAPAQDSLADLIAAMELAGLGGHAAAAREWCKEQGASLLEEVVEFFDDFVLGLGLSDQDREKLARQLQIEDKDCVEARQLIQATEAELERLNAEAKKAVKKQKGPLLASIKELEESPEYLAAKRLLENPVQERERRRAERSNLAEAKVRSALAARDLNAAVAALADFRAAGGVSGNDTSSFVADIAALRAELAAASAAEGGGEDERRRRMENRKARTRRGFAFEPPSGAELEPPKAMKLNVDAGIGAGIDAHGSWYGMIVDVVDDEPGQLGLNVGDCIVTIAGISLREREVDDCEMAFVDALVHGVEVEVEPRCMTVGLVPPEVIPRLDWATLQQDMAGFSQDYQVELKVSSDKREVRLSGPQSAVGVAREEALGFLSAYFPM